MARLATVEAGHNERAIRLYVLIHHAAQRAL
jgi:hypothetical protein